MIASIISAAASLIMAAIGVLFIWVGFKEGAREEKSGAFLGVALLFAISCFLIAIMFATIGGW